MEPLLSSTPLNTSRFADDYTTELQTFAEEVLNTIIHGMGLVASIPAAVLLVLLARRHGGLWHMYGCGLYAMSLVMMYTCSTLYHWSGISDVYITQEKLRDLDHCAVFFLIAGTYTPLTLINGIYNNMYNATHPKGSKARKEKDRAIITGWIVLGIVWLMCIVGVTSKLAFGSEGVHPVISYGFYMVMGYVAAFGGTSFLKLLPKTGLRLLVAGGLSYTVGICFLLSDSIPFNHPVWHLFVGAGSILHYFSVIACSIPIAENAVIKRVENKQTRSKVLDQFTRFAYANFCKNI
jgi:hemolysin III